MVYLGPSRGCQTCRSRKIKCDETKPCCLQCIKSNKTCKGYRNTIFIEERPKVEERAAKRRDKSPVKRVRNSDLNAVPLGMTFDNEQLSIGFFMNINVDGFAHKDMIGGFMDLAPSLYGTTPMNSALAAATVATALRSSSLDARRSELQELATVKYTNAIRAVNDAFEQAEAWRSDSLLLAVLMLGMYEHLGSQWTHTAWRDKHYRGAAALVTARSRSCSEPSFSPRLILAVQGRVLRCAIAGSDPKLIENFTTAIEGLIPPSYEYSTVDRLVQMSTGIPRLRAEVATLRVQSNNIEDEALDLYQRAKEVDREVAGWIDHLPEDYTYTNYVDTPTDQAKTRDVYPQGLYSYKHVPAACNWNQWRIHRLYALSTAVECATILESRDVKLPGAAHIRDTAQTLADDICASIPYYLGYCRGDGIQDEACHFPHAAGTVRGPASKSNNAWFVVPPMAFLARLNFLPEGQRRWCKAYADHYATNADVLVC